MFPAEVGADRATIAAGGPTRTRSSPGGVVELLVLPAGTDPDLTGWAVVCEDADGTNQARDSVE